MSILETKFREERNMTKKEFLDELTKQLKGLPQSEIDKTITFYSEIIEDHMEEGATEEEAVEALESIEEIVKNATFKAPLTGLVKEKVKKSINFTGPVIALLILGSPLWISLLLALLSIVVGLLFAVGGVIFGLFVTVGAILFSGIMCVVALPFIFAENPLAGTFLLGVGLIFVGGSIFLVYGAKFVTKYLIKGMKWLVIKIKSFFVKEVN